MQDKVGGVQNVFVILVQVVVFFKIGKEVEEVSNGSYFL